MPGFGRVRVEDPRDLIYPLRAAVDSRIARAEAPRKPRRQWPVFRTPLDQGAESTCVGHAWKHWMMSAPVIQTKPDKPPTAPQIYDLATLSDEWTGNERDRHFGTSVRAGAQVLRGMGIVGEFRWEWLVDGCIEWLKWGGP